MSLIEAHELKHWQDLDEDFLLFDCRFDLVDSEAGYQSYLQGHIPGAIYVHSDKDLATSKNGQNGRHPLPSIKAWQTTYASLGITPNKKVVIYDNQGSMFAVRLWWMLHSVGHKNVYLLNGGYPSWVGAGLPIETSETFRQTVPETQLQNYQGLVLVDAVEKNLQNPQFKILDARANDRFHGNNETLDPVAGHIPGAMNRCFKDNLEADGRFKNLDVLRAEFAELLKGLPSDQIVHQCGSGITACHNLFTMELLGLKNSSLYAGSWSEWCSNPSRPIEK
ncbi:MAG: sulfurtransferase [Polynucleobacter sp.]|nr:MAG: sulfurtransferase [Polynucleobacter sp.]